MLARFGHMQALGSLCGATLDKKPLANLASFAGVEAAAQTTYNMDSACLCCLGFPGQGASAASPKRQ